MFNTGYFYGVSQREEEPTLKEKNWKLWARARAPSPRKSARKKKPTKVKTTVHFHTIHIMAWIPGVIIIHVYITLWVSINVICYRGSCATMCRYSYTKRCWKKPLLKCSMFVIMFQWLVKAKKVQFFFFFLLLCSPLVFCPPAPRKRTYV